MHKKEKDHISLLERALKKLWRKYNPAPVIKAKHTEISVEPRPFIGGKLNPQIADFILRLYLQKVKVNPNFNGEIEVRDGILKVKDKNGRLIAETTSPKIIREYLN